MENKEKKRKIYRFFRLTLLVFLILYIAVTAVMAFFQSHFIFPGQHWQGAENTADLHCANTENDRIIELTTASGVKTKMRLLTQPSDSTNGSLADTNKFDDEKDGEKEKISVKKTAVPTILYFYGNCGSLSWADRMMKEFYKLGVNVACVEWPGFGVAEGKVSEKGTYEAADAIYDRLVNVEKIPPETIYILGHSLGTGPAADLASRKKCAGTILASGFTTIPAVSQYYYPYLPGQLVVVSRFATSKKIPKMTAPLLLIHSQDDQTIPFFMSEKNEKIAKKNNVPVEFLRLTSAGHDLFFDQDESASVWTAIKNFVHPE